MDNCQKVSGAPSTRLINRVFRDAVFPEYK
jgi:hypothetical protein